MDEREYLFRFFGYGDPKSPVWFIGIEEGGEQGVGPKPEGHATVQLEGESFHYDPKLPSHPGSPVWSVARELAAAAGVPGRYFLSNMAPFARPRESDALNDIVPSEYHTRVRTERIPALLRLARHLGAKALVFHGKGAWRRYDVQTAAGLTLSERTPAGSRVLAFARERVVLSGSFSRGTAFTRADREAAASVLHEWCSES